MTTHRSLSLNSLIVLVAVGVVVVAIVASALASGTLPVLLAGAAVLLGIVSVFSAFVVRQYVRWNDARLKAIEAQNQHEQAMAKLGYLKNDSRFQPIKQIAAPAPEQTASRVVDGIHFMSPDPRVLALHLLRFTINLGRADKNLIATAPECAAAGIHGYTNDKRQAAVQYLKDHYDVSTLTGRPENGGGTFVPESIGTVRKLYDMVLTDSAVDALPGVTR